MEGQVSAVGPTAIWTGVKYLVVVNVRKFSRLAQLSVTVGVTTVKPNNLG